MFHNTVEVGALETEFHNIASIARDPTQDEAHQPDAMSATVIIAHKMGKSRDGSPPRGLRYVLGSFIQNGEVEQWNADYGSPTLVVSHNIMEQPTTWLLDTTPNAPSPPWYAFKAPTGLTNRDTPVINYRLVGGDRPNLDAADPTQMSGTGEPSVGASHLAVNNLRVNFRLYVAVNTLDLSNGASQIYIQRAVAEWHFDGTGDTSSGTWKPLKAHTNGVDSPFQEVTDGSPVPVTGGHTMDLLVGAGWNTPVSPPTVK